MQHVLVGCILLFSLLLEGTILSVPLLVPAVVVTSVIYRNAWFIAGVFLIGIAFDIMTMQKVGSTSIFLMIIVALTEAYRRKFETRTFPFVAIAASIAVAVYILIFGTYAFFVQLVTGVVFASILYFLFFRFGFLAEKER